MSEILKSPTRNQKQSSAFFADVFWCRISSWNFSHKHDIYSLIYMNIHMEKTFHAMQCQKCRKYFKKKWESQNTCKKSTWFFLAPGCRFQYFRHLLQNPNFKLITGFPNNHYWSYTFLNPWALQYSFFFILFNIQNWVVAALYSCCHFILPYFVNQEYGTLIHI